MSVSLAIWVALILFAGIVLGFYLSSFYIEREKRRLISDCEATVDKYKKQVKALEENLKGFKKIS